MSDFSIFKLLTTTSRCSSKDQLKSGGKVFYVEIEKKPRGIIFPFIYLLN